MRKGFDANRDVSPFASCLKRKGYSFVCRYYNINNHSKNLTFSEANFLSMLNLSIVPVWENGFPTSSNYFSHSKGVSDGSAAYEYALTTIKQPPLTPIYFAVDYDASSDDVNGVISEYFQGISDAFNQISKNKSVYQIGVYGSGLVCKTMMSSNLASFSWLAQSVGWRGSKTYKGYNIKQLLQIVECVEAGVIKGDPDESPNDNEGSFKLQHLADAISFLNPK